MSHGPELDGAPAGTKYLVVLCRVDDLFRPDGEITVHLKGYTQSSKFPISSWRKWLPPPQFVWRPVRGGLYSDDQYQSDVILAKTSSDNPWIELLSEGKFGLNTVGRMETAKKVRT